MSTTEVIFSCLPPMQSLQVSSSHRHTSTYSPLTFDNWETMYQMVPLVTPHYFAKIVINIQASAYQPRERCFLWPFYWGEPSFVSVRVPYSHAHVGYLVNHRFLYFPPNDKRHHIILLACLWINVMSKMGFITCFINLRTIIVMKAPCVVIFQQWRKWKQRIGKRQANWLLNNWRQRRAMMERLTSVFGQNSSTVRRNKAHQSVL